MLTPINAEMKNRMGAMIPDKMFARKKGVTDSSNLFERLKAIANDQSTVIKRVN